MIDYGYLVRIFPCSGLRIIIDSGGTIVNAGLAAPERSISEKFAKKRFFGQSAFAFFLLFY